MKYSTGTIPSTKGGLRDAVTFTMAYAPDYFFPDWTGLDFDGAFEQLFLGVDNLRRKFGDAKADQLLDMLHQAKAHFEWGHEHGSEQGQAGLRGSQLGCRLMQDIDMVIADRQPFSYPRELYRWHVDAMLPKPSESDFTDQVDADDD